MSFFHENYEEYNKWIKFFKNVNSIHGNTGINHFKDDFGKFSIFYESFIAGLSRQFKAIDRDFHKFTETINALKRENKLATDLLKKEKDDKSVIEKELQLKVEELAKERASKRTYASVVSSNNIPMPKPDFVCIVDAVDSSINDSKQTLSYLNSKLDCKMIVDNKIKIIKQVPIRNKKVLIKCPSKADCTAVGNIINDLNCGLKAKVPEKKKPRLLILGVEKEILEKDFIDILTTQNNDIKNCLQNEGESIEVVISKSDRIGTNFFVLSVSPNIYHLCLQMGQVFLGHKVCNVKKGNYVSQCFKCLRFGHVTNNCKNDPVCHYCHQNHESNDCPAKDENGITKCYNCDWKNKSIRGNNNIIPIDHSVYSKSCPQYVLAEKRLNESIDYGL
ncbi:uncharacterized protein LOC113789309 [Dermatophagoides pteronyssinus]|uniref:Uncharacterized protein LOC113789309 n=1 Tax=Dermatophagoides pteronyssinus TaxID=6956 RepID=A0A6P6XRV6_DERPT|nr:uncharacterized protein LOC113789309 [Dermatophagoides pteronyssinus]